MTTLTPYQEPLGLRCGPEDDDVFNLIVHGPGAERVQGALADLLDLRDSTVSLVCQALAALERGGSVNHARNLLQELQERARRLSELDVES